MIIVGIVALLFHIIAFYSLSFNSTSLQTKIIIFFLFFNPFFFSSLLSFEGIVISSLIIRIGGNLSPIFNHLLDIILCFRPPFICVTLIGQERKQFWIKLLLAVVMIKVDYGQIIFPQTFSSGTNLMWLLYIHMFKKYTLLYQMLMTMIPFLSIYPLKALKIPLQLKQAIIFFFSSFVSNTNSHAFLLGFVVLYALMYPKLAEKKIQNGYQIWSLLTLIIIIVDVMFYTFYQILVNLWEHTHMTNMGYILVNQVVFWIANGVYLSEGIQLFGMEKQKKQRGWIKEYVRQKIKDI